MDILDVRRNAIDNQYHSSALDMRSCERIIDRAFKTLLEELEKSFDEDASRHWGSWEVSDMLHSMRMQIK